MKKKNNKHGFTLAELLIVVAIIAVLTAIAIPVFSAQLEKARDATDQANIRSAYAELSAAILTASTDADIITTLNTGSFTWTAGTGTYTAAVAGKGQNNTWDNQSSGFVIGDISVRAVPNFTSVAFAVNSDNQITGITLGSST